MFSLVLVSGVVGFGPHPAAAQRPISITGYSGPTLFSQDWVCTDYCEEEWQDGYYINTYRIVFTIRNNTSAEQYAWVSQQCGATSFCYPLSQPHAWWDGPLSPNQARNVFVYVTVPPTGSYSTTVTFSVTRASYDWCWDEYNEWPCEFSAAGPWDTMSLIVSGSSGSASVTPGIFAYRPTVTPKNSTAELIPFDQTVSKAFTIQNAGTQSATYSIAALCGSIANCTPSKTSTTLAPSETDTVTVSFTSPGTTTTSNMIKLIASYTSGSQAIADTGLRPTVTPAVRPSVYPKNGAATVNGTGGWTTQSFSASGYYTFTPYCQGWATNCTIHETWYDEENENYVVTVAYYPPAALGSATYPTAKIGVIGTVSGVADTGFVTASLAYAKPVFSPKTASITVPANSNRTYWATFTNAGNTPTGYSLTVSCTVLANCSLVPTFINVNAGATGSTMISYGSPPIGQTGTMRVIASRVAPITNIVEADTATITITSADQLSPTLSVIAGYFPPEGSTTGIGALSFTLRACDPDGVLQNPVITRNGTTVSTGTSYTSPIISSCNSTKEGAVSFIAQPGANSVDLSVSDGSHTTTIVRHFTYNDSAEAMPVVTPQQQSRLLRAGVQASDTFLVRNPGPNPITYSLAAACTAALTGCTANQATLPVGAGQAEKMWITYTTTNAAAGTVWPIVRYTTASGALVEGNNAVYTTIYIDRYAPTMAITAPASGETIGAFPNIVIDWCDADGQLQTHTVTMNGAPLAANFTTTSASGCASAGTSSWTAVPLILGSNTLVVRATDAAGHDTSVTRTFTLSLPAVADFQPRVTPTSAARYLLPQEQTWKFAVTNAGALPAQYQLAADCSQVAAQLAGSCQLDKTTTFLLAPGAVDTVGLTFTLSALPANQQTVGLTATYTNVLGQSATHSGLVTGLIPTFAQLYQPAVGGASGWNPITPGWIAAWAASVTNLGFARVKYVMGVGATNGFVPVLPYDTLTVEPGQTVTYPFQIRAPSAANAQGSVTVIAAYQSGGQSVIAASETNVQTTSGGGGGGTGIIAVTPKGISRAVPANQQDTIHFTIARSGAGSSTYSFRIRCEPFVGSGSASSVACDDSTGTTSAVDAAHPYTVIARVNGTSTDADGRVTLAVLDGNGAVLDSGYVRTTLRQSGRIAVVTRPVNSENVIERAGCLTIAAGQAAAYQCGDLRLAHGLPATTTMNRLRAPSLIYSSRHAEGGALVAADVSVKPGPSLTGLRLTLKVEDAAGTIRVDTSKTIPWNDAWNDDKARRFVLGFDAPSVSLLAPGQTAGAFKYTFEAASLTNPSDVAQSVGTIIVVDRSTSEFGRGWWLEGLEQLILMPNDSIRVWVGGDGSARVFKKSNDTVWTVTPKADHPDTLIRIGSVYRRKLTNGAYVEFDYLGRHVKTRNRQGHVTSFAWDNGPSRLRTISLPVPNGSSATRVYTLNYDPSSPARQLVNIVPPSAGIPRTTTFYQTVTGSSSRLDSIADPDGKRVRFIANASGRIVKRVSRMRDTTVFHYDEGGGLDSSRTKMLGQGSDIVHAFCVAETASLTSCLGGAPLASAVRTKYDGPRLDVEDTTAFYLDRFGAPAKIINALGDSTLIERDPVWPLLVSAVVLPNGHRSEAIYDPTRALLLRSIEKNPFEDGRDAITHYSWNSPGPFNLLEQITTPTNQITKFGYTSDGDRWWQEDGRGEMSRAWFTYNADRQLQTIRPPGNSITQVDSNAYEPATGNLSSTKSPGNAVVTYRTDAIGRVDSISTPLANGQRKAQRFVYDTLDRVTEWWDIGPAVNYNIGGVSGTAPAVSLRVTTTFDDDGNPLEIRRRSLPDMAIAGDHVTTRLYDRAGRKIAEYQSGGSSTILGLDPAGNDTSMTSGRGVTIKKKFDALNRVTWRITPSVSRDSALGQVSAGDPCAQVPRFPHFNGSDEYQSIYESGCGGLNTAPPHKMVIPRDSAAFTYTKNGQLETANNSAARVRREYFKGGALKHELQNVAQFAGLGTYDDSRFTSHMYSMWYTYDLSGRRTTRTDTLPTCVGCVQRYEYDPVTGFLANTSDGGAGYSRATVYFPAYDAAGRLQSVTWNGQSGVRATTENVFDEEGRLKVRTVTAQGTMIYSDQLAYDPVGRVVGTSMIDESTTVAYNGLGALAALERYQSATGAHVDEYVTDGFSNRIETRKWQAGQYARHQYRYSGQLLEAVNQVRPQPAQGSLPVPPPDLLRTMDTVSTYYDGSGNVIGTFRDVRQWTADTLYDPLRNGREWTWHVYDGDERLRVSQRSFIDAGAMRTAFTEYRYDALGRRVLARTRWDQYCQAAAPKCVSTLERTIWDGDQILMEARAAGSLGAEPGEALLNGNRFYGTVRYTHAGAIDEPLIIWKSDKGGIIPLRSWRGNYEAGTGVDASAGGVTWPARTRDIFQAPDARLMPIEQSDWIGSIVEGKTDPSGLQYMRNRYYDPRTGRFTQEDPIGLAGGMNLYGFAGGDPVNASDPFGLSPTDIIVQGENSKKVVDYLYENSDTFREAYDRLNNDHSVHLTIRDAQSPFEVNAFVPGEGKSGTIIFNDVNLNQANYLLMKADPKANFMFTGASVLGHEMGHANAFLGNGPSACRLDNPPGCILRFENKVRGDLPASERGGFRPRYSFTPGQP